RRTKSLYPGRIDIHATGQGDPINGRKMLGMLIGHAASTQNEDTHSLIPVSADRPSCFKSLLVVPARAGTTRALKNLVLHFARMVSGRKLGPAFLDLFDGFSDRR